MTASLVCLHFLATCRPIGLAAADAHAGVRLNTRHNIFATRQNDRAEAMYLQFRKIGEDLARKDRPADITITLPGHSDDAPDHRYMHDPRPHYTCEFDTTTTVQPRKNTSATTGYSGSAWGTDEDVKRHDSLLQRVKEARNAGTIPPAYSEQGFQPCLADTNTKFSIVATANPRSQTSVDQCSNHSIYLDLKNYDGEPDKLQEIVLHKDSKFQYLFYKHDALAHCDAQIRSLKDEAMSARTAGQDSATVGKVQSKAEDWERFRVALSNYLESGEALPYCPEFKSSTPQDSNSNSDSAASTGAERDQQPVFGQLRPFRIEESASMRTVLEDGSVIYRPVRLNAQSSDLHTMLPGGEALLRAHTDEASWGQPDSLMSSCVVS